MISTTQKFLTKEQAADIAPAILTKTASPERSKRYIFVDSERIIDSMDENGYANVTMYNRNDVSAGIIRAVCAYL